MDEQGVGRGKEEGRALVVDDDASLRMVAGEVVERVGLLVETAESGERALEILDRGVPDICLIDIEMPGMSGFDLCEAIRCRPDGARVPLVVMTGHDDIQSIQRAYDVGATDFITKPPNWFVFEQRIRYILRARRNLDALQASRQRLANAQRIARVGFWHWERDGGSMECSEELCRILGLRPGERIEELQSLQERVHPDDLGRILELLSGPVDSSVPLELEFRIRTPTGEDRVLWTEARLAIDESGSIAAVDGTSQDVTRRREAEDKIRHLAYHDGLTGLANRRFLLELLDQALKHATRQERRVGLLYADIDHFKRINDSFGHAVGDEVLRIIAKRLSESVRDSDRVSREIEEPEGSGIARLGGDEFTILLSEIRDVRSADAVARRILRRLSEPLQVRGQELVVSASIGISLWPDDCDDADTLIQHADTAMYYAKREGRGGARFYSQSMNDEALKFVRLESRLRRALDREEIAVHYQPLVDARTGELVGAEALARWNDAEEGVVPPIKFIPLAEELGLIDRLGEQVLGKACTQFRSWIDAGLDPGYVTLNVSAQQVNGDHFAERLLTALRDTRLPLSRVELEFTESILLRDVNRVAALLAHLTGSGVSASLDDFGTGYSCLKYLRELPVSTIKIDRSFVRDVPADPSAGVVCNVIIQMARALDMRTVAEGVETEEQRRYLQEKGCNTLQGYLFSHALAAPEFEALLRRVASGEAPFGPAPGDGT